MIGGIHHAALAVASVTEAHERWSRLLGLTGETGGGLALLRCAYEDHCLVLEEDDRPGLRYVAYRLARGRTLVDAAARLRELDVPHERHPVPGAGEGLRLDDPDGNAVVLVECPGGPNAVPDVARATTTLPAFHPRKLGHVNYLTGDIRRAVAFYERLGFRVSDWLGDEGCWLHVNRDHHVLAFLDKGFAHVHHLAFELVDWGEMRVALDHLGQHGRPMTWGPGRHGIAQNLFAYFRMPEEDMFIELFADLEQLETDHEPRRFPDDAHASNVWGALPPRSYFRFDEESVRAELESLQ